MTMKKRRSLKRKTMRGGNALMPGDANGSYEIGGFAASQHQAGATSMVAPDLNIIQSGGKLKKRWQRGGMYELQPTEIGGSTGSILPPPAPAQTGGNFSTIMKSAMVPLGLFGLNKYAHDYSGKKVYKGKSRLSKRLRSHRNRR